MNAPGIRQVVTAVKSAPQADVELKAINLPR